MITLLTSGNVILFAALLIVLILSLSFHEYGHAWAAGQFGDDTPARMGRLTLNPLVHIDPMGLLMVILVGFGYARPVITDPRNYNSHWAQLGVAAAGPAANLIIAFVAVNLLGLGLRTESSLLLANPGVFEFLYLLAQVNVALMLFNLIPIGPLDGHYILPYFLPRALALQYEALNARYGTLLILGLLVASWAGLPVLDWLFGLIGPVFDVLQMF